jgi:hypothetical protein
MRRLGAGVAAAAWSPSAPESAGARVSALAAGFLGWGPAGPPGRLLQYSTNTPKSE